MKKKIHIAIAAFILLVLFIACKQEPEIIQPNIKGRISIPQGTTYSEFWVKSSDGMITSIDNTGYFEIYGLDSDKQYDFYFSNSEQSSATIRSKSTPKEIYGALKRDVSLKEKESVDLGIIPMRHTNTVKGIVTLQGKSPEENAGIDVYIPGTIFAAETDSTGAFELKNIPEGVFRIEFSKQGYVSASVDNTIVACDSDGKSTTKKLTDVVLAENSGNVFGLVSLEGLADFSGVKVSIRGTTFETTSNSDGEYYLQIPSGTYNGGIIYECEDYKTVVDSSPLKIETGELVTLPSVSMEASKSRQISGTVIVRGASDYSGVEVTFSRGSDKTSVSTDKEGKWVINHLSIGEYTVSITADNMESLSFPYTLKAGFNDLGEFNLVADGASAYGYVQLPNTTNWADVTVKITNKTTSDSYSYKTKADGFYKFTNLDVSSDYTLTFVKDGWDTKNVDIEDLFTFEKREISNQVLTDSISPTINSFKVNNGEHTTTERNVTITIDAADLGTGLNQLLLSYDSSFSSPFYKGEYITSFSTELSSGNTIKTIYLRVSDFSGNISDSSVQIKLKAEKTEVKGILSGDSLHWTEESSPYLVNGNIVVPVGQTLLIDPGVDIQIEGSYSIQVEGTIQAIGTANNNINFFGTGYGIDNWDGIIGVSSDITENGNWLDYVTIRGAKNACSGYLRVTNSEINGSVSSFGKVSAEWETTVSSRFLGYVEKCTINGDMRVYSATFINNDINCLYIMGGNYGSSETYSTFISNRITKVGTPSSYYADWGFCMGGSTVVNNLITDLYMYMDNPSDYGPTKFEYNTMINSVFYNSCRTSTKSPLRYNSFENCYIHTYILHEIYYYEFSDCNFDDRTTISTSWKNPSTTMHYTNCYWGPNHTEELQAANTTDNISFIRDYYDDYTVAKIDWSDWLDSPVVTCGYQGPDFSL